MTLQYYSAKAYEHVRTTFNLALPHQAQIRKWYSKIPAGPGFTQPAFDALKAHVEKRKSKNQDILCALMLQYCQEITWHCVYPRPARVCVLRPLCPRLARVRPAFGPHDARVLRPRCPRAACVLRPTKLRLAGRTLRSILGKPKNIVEIRFTLTEQVSLFVHSTVSF